MVQLRRKSEPRLGTLSSIQQSMVIKAAQYIPTSTIGPQASPLPQRLYYVLTLVMVQLLWMTMDRISHALSWDRFEPPPVRIIPNITTPLPPIHFYEKEYTGPARAFPIYKGDFCSGPFISQEDMGLRTNPSYGLLFIKEMKTGSTTLSGITARIARNTAARIMADEEHPPSGGNSTGMSCMTRFVHMRARRFRNRDPERSFLWTVVREPTARLLSGFMHFGVSREDLPADLDSFRKYINRKEVQDLSYYFKSLSLRAKLNPYRQELYTQFTDEILTAYDFIGVSERMEESLAVLQLLLNLPTQDMLYISTKTKGSYDYFPSKQKCTFIPKLDDTVMTLPFKKYLYDEEFEEYVAGDIVMYRAANRSLDLTIDALGRSHVERAVRRLQVAQRIAMEECLSTTRFPCTSDGVHQPENDCLQQDVACGYKCLDRVSSEVLSKSAKFSALPI